MKECHQLKPEKVSIKKIDKPVVESFLQWLENTRNNSISTRNQRLAAIHAFFRYLQGENPDHLFHCQKVISIPFKRNQKNTVDYLTEKSIKKVLTMPDTTTVNGRRDLTLLSTLYDTGARVQEIVDLKVRDVRLESPAIVCLTGKGRKIRHVPIMKQTEALLRQYLQEQRLTAPDKLDYPLFFNHQKNIFTRQGITYILNKYTSDVLSTNVSPHMLRHSKAMHMLHAGINLIYIRDFLGHSELATTEIYARANSEMKLKALKKINKSVIPENVPNWQENKYLMDWLHKLC